MRLEDKEEFIDEVSKQVDLKTDEYTFHFDLSSKLILESYAHEIKILIENLINKY